MNEIRRDAPLFEKKGLHCENAEQDQCTHKLVSLYFLFFFFLLFCERGDFVGCGFISHTYSLQVSIMVKVKICRVRPRTKTSILILAISNAYDTEIYPMVVLVNIGLIL
jgi:hypothetical protein